jgi:hypothetical protein
MKRNRRQGQAKPVPLAKLEGVFMSDSLRRSEGNYKRRSELGRCQEARARGRISPQPIGERGIYASRDSPLTHGTCFTLSLSQRNATHTRSATTVLHNSALQPLQPRQPSHINPARCRFPVCLAFGTKIPPNSPTAFDHNTQPKKKSIPTRSTASVALDDLN